jgi:hypothetical protein
VQDREVLAEAAPGACQGFAVEVGEAQVLLAARLHTFALAGVEVFGIEEVIEVEVSAECIAIPVPYAATR